MIFIKILSIEEKAYPEQLKIIPSPPKVLYILGNEKLLFGPNIAVIGSRNATEYGIKQARRFSQELSLGGFNIVSGMAKGIDRVSHEACISVHGKTIAVLGSGFNNIYPKENTDLFYNILQNDGLIITEYAPNIRANTCNFPARNRIISGISKGVLVIEAAYRSGTSITANFAKLHGKDVYCLPGNIDSNKSIGTDRLIQKGAKIVIKPYDILKNYPLITSNHRPSIMHQNNIPYIYKKTYDTIQKTGSHLDYIAQKLKKPIPDILQELLMMELEGLIERKAGGYYVPKA